MGVFLSRPWRLVRGVGALILFIAGAGGLYTFLQQETVDRGLAHRYLTHYYEEATKDPSRCCYDELDPLFRENMGIEDKDEYVSFFRKYEAIKVSRVRRTDEGLFRAHLTYHDRGDEAPVEEAILFDLRCRARTRLPFIGCGVDDVRIRDTHFAD